MTWSKRFGDVAVVLAAAILIADQERDRRSGSASFEYTGENFDDVRFAPLRDMTRGTGLAAIEVFLNVGLGQSQSRRAPVHDTADRGSVAFPERGDAEQLPEGIAGHDGIEKLFWSLT
jgi:hypothetical protein